MATEGSLFEDYAAYHRDPRNLICHEIGIPLIVLGIIGLLRLVTLPAWNLNLAAIALIAAIVYYLVAFGRTERAATFIAIAGLVLLYGLSGFLAWPYAVGAFVVGWIAQFIGHAYEGKSPAFLTNLVHLLVGPLWVASHLVPPSASSSSVR